MDTIRIKGSNIKILAIIILASFVGFLSFQLFIKPENYVSVIFKNEDLIKFSGFIGFIFFVVSLMFIFIKIYKGEFGLKLDENGITDYSSYVSIGLIKWSDISEIKKTKVISTDLLQIYLFDNKKYLDKTQSKFKRRLMKSNIKLYNTPIIISSNSLSCNFDELEKLIKDKYEKYKT